MVTSIFKVNEIRTILQSGKIYFMFSFDNSYSQGV